MKKFLIALLFAPIMATFALLAWGFGARTADQATLFQSGWFVESLLTQTLVVHLLRSPHPPWQARRPGRALLLTSVALAGLALWLPQGPLAPWLKLQPLPAAYFALLPGLLLAYLGLVQWRKAAWVRRHGWQ